MHAAADNVAERSRSGAMRHALQVRLQLVRALPTAGRGLAAASVLATIIGSLLPACFTLASGVIAGSLPGAVRGAVDAGGLDSPDGRRLVVGLIAATVIYVCIHLMGPVRETLGDVLMRRLDEKLTTRVMRAVSTLRGVAHLEDSLVLDKIAQAQGLVTGFTPGAAAYYLIQVWAQRLQGAASLAIVARFSIWVAVMVLAGHLITFRWRQWHWKEVTSVIMGHTDELRRSHYLRNLSFEPDAAKELRIFALDRWLVDTYRGAFLGPMRKIWAERRAGGLVALSVTALMLAVEGGALALIAAAGVRGAIGLGAVVVYSQAVVAASNLGTFGEGNVRVEEGAMALRVIAELEQLVPTAGANLSGTLPAEGLPARTLRFEGVGFRYPGRHEDVFAGLELEIEAGKSLAIVGENGAGKTTLVKLLTRLYDPTEGRITVDDSDLRDIDPAAWQRRVGAVFQDFVQYHLTAYDNVAVAALHRRDDADAVYRAADSVGATAVIEGLPFGWDTIMSRQYEGGAEVSGGEWQRIAPAGAMFAVAGGAGVLILDEPTAALDVRGEAELYERFLELTHGVTTIVISHRFSTVRRADRIVVLEHGQVVEDGTHDELVAAGGRYAHMYRLQAARFHDPVADASA